MRDFSLRERKFARTKAELMQALVARLDAHSLADVSVKEVCHDVQVSESTFFNYFDSKQAAVAYAVQLWSIASAWEIEQCVQRTGSHLQALRAVFDLTGERDAETPGLMGEILVYQTRLREPFNVTPLTPAEYAHHFPDAPGIEKFEAQGIDRMFMGQLSAARESGELPPHTDLPSLCMTLMSIFFVTPVLIRLGTADSAKAAYRRQLDQLLP